MVRAGRPVRRTFSAEYKRRIVAEYDQAPAGQKGRVLRREGLYDSSVKQWRAQIEAGTLGTVSQRRPRAGQSPEQARIAEDAGASAVMALERVPADIRAQGGVARMSDPDLIEGIIDAALDGTLAEKENEKATFARLAAATVETGVNA